MAITDNLKAYWKMDEASGNIVDIHNSHTGTPTGTPTYGQTGKLGNAILLTKATPDYFTVPDHADLTLSASMTIAVWVKPATTGGYILDKGVWGQDGYILVANVGGSDLDFYTKQSGAYQRSNSTTAIASGSWSYLMVIVSAGTAKLYINNTEVSYDNHNTHTAPADGATSLLIGKYQGNSTSNFDGVFDDLALWNRALSDAERNALWNSGSGLAYPFTAAPISRIQINIGDTWKDVIPAGASGTFTNGDGDTVTFVDGIITQVV